ncbi:hypothetical protein IIA79_00015 [bacterium]|nr:hypothetical protein [bacterium]
MADKRAAAATPSVPEEVWDGCEYTSIHAAVLFADLENSVMISSALPPPDYNRLINAFQAAMLELVGLLRDQGMPIGEVYVAGDQLSIFFYDHEEVRRNYLMDGPQAQEGEARALLIAECKSSYENLVLSALKAAIQLKNLWLIQEFNLERVLANLDPWELGTGIHYGRVYLGNRPDGKRRIEGYTVNLAKRIEGYSRRGNYSHVMVSQQVRDTIRSSVVKHTQLRQRIFFYKHDVALELLKGVARAQAIHELKFYHRIGIHVPHEVIEQYEAIFAVDRTNIWAYYQLVDYYAYQAGDWERVFELAKVAHLVHPQDEKVLLDLAKYYLQKGELAQSTQFAEEALRLNESFDLVHEHLAIIASKAKDHAAQIRHWRTAVRLGPGSPVNNFNLGLALLSDDQPEEGAAYVQEALRSYPDYKSLPVFVDALSQLRDEGKLPEALSASLEPAGEKAEGKG